MTTPKLTHMSFSQHRRYTGSEPLSRCTDPRKQEKGQHGLIRGLLGALLRQWRTYQLLQEKKRVWSSFQRVAEALGQRTDRQQQTTEQSARLARIREIEQQLRTINYTDL